MARRDALVDNPRYLLTRHRVPLTLDSHVLRPLPPALWGMACTWCDKAQASWVHISEGEQRETVLCAHCWLYVSEWGRARQVDIEGFLHDVEVQLEQTLPRDTDGRLAYCRDADRVLGAIAVTSRIFHCSRMMGRLRTDDGT